MGLELARAFIRVRADHSQAGKDIDRSKGMILGKLGGIARSASGLMAGIGLPLGGAAMFGSLIRGGEMFDRKMRNSLSIMKEVEGQHEALKEAAFEAASTTQFSAAEAAESYFFLASAGLNAKQSITALPQVAQFAQAGMFDMAQATNLATDAQSALGLTVDDAQQNLTNLTRVTDVLVSANTLANASVEEFSTALTTRAGVAARDVGKEIEEVVAVLGVMADQGEKSQRAGTGFAIVMRDLQTKARENAGAFKAANVAVFDQNDEMRNMADIVGDLEKHLEGMSDKQRGVAMAQLGFSDKSRGFISLLMGQSETIRQYQQDLEGAEGTTRRVADMQLTAFQKGAAKLGSAWTKLGSTITTGSSDMVGNALGFLGDLVNQTTVFVKEMQFVFRNFSAIAQVAIIDLVMAGLRLFPQLEGPIGRTAAFFVGTWSGVKAFFSTIIESMLGGLKELANFAKAVGAGIKAAFMAISAGNFTGAAAAFGDAFVKTLAAQEDVKAKNAFAEFGKAFNQAREDTLQTFQERGGFGTFLEEERDRLLQGVAESEAALAEARKKADKKKEAAGPAEPGEEGPAGAGAALEAKAIGFAELGKTIQEQLLKDDTPMKQLQETQKQTGILQEQLAVQKKGGGGGLIAGGESA